MMDGFDIATYLRAMDEPEMSDEVFNMANRLEAFSDGLDRDILEVKRKAFDDVTKQRDKMLSALRIARDCIAEDCQSLFDCHRNPATGTIDDLLALDAFDRYVAVLSDIDAAIAE